MQYSPKSSLASWPVEMTSPEAATSGTAGAPVGCCPVGASAAGAARHCDAAHQRDSEIVRGQLLTQQQDRQR